MNEEDFHKQHTLPGEVAKEREQEDFEVPKQIGPYKIESLLETGGMNYVYLGTDPKTQGTVTIKALLPKFTDNPEVVTRFLNEAKIIEKTDHPNIVRLYEHGEWEGGLYIALEFIEGQSLRQYLQSHHISLKRALEIILEISYALCHLHTHGIIHRDLKLENILTDKNGNIKVIDFGIARILSEKQENPESQQPRIIGTPIYMSPEQRDNPESVTYASDIYSLGIIAYELILGKLSHGKIHLSLMPKGLQKTLSKALQPNPEDRYQDMVDFISAISAYMNSAMLEKEKKSGDQLSEMAENIEHAQEKLSPHAGPKWPEITCGMLCHKGSKYAGIYYDFLNFANGMHGIICSETTAKGAEGVVFNAYLKGLVNSLAMNTPNIQVFFEQLNSLLLKNDSHILYPFSLLTLDPNSQSYTYTSCSYGSLWFFDAHEDEPRLITCNNPTLGIEMTKSFQHIEGNWKEQDQLLLSSLPPVGASEGQISQNQFIETYKEVHQSTPQKQVEHLFRKTRVDAKQWMDSHSLFLISLHFR